MRYEAGQLSKDAVELRAPGIIKRLVIEQLARRFSLLLLR